MSDSPTCPTCDGPIPTTGDLAGTCPKCLLGARPEVIYTRAREQRAGGPGPNVELDAVQGMFPDLEILEVLGRGGMGVVYKARQPHLDRFVAVKLLASEIAGDPDFATRFLREARALARLNHPNIVGVYDFGEKDGSYYLVMEFVEGTSLRAVIQRGAMQPDEALAIVPQICAGLQFAHEAGIVHRDIKPENILLDMDGNVKIADFGLAKLVDGEAERLTHANQVMGTPHYMAPEQVNSPRAVDHRADIYSLGVVFYEMLTHELPVGRFPKPSEKAAVDVRLDEVVVKALEQEPESRYQAISEVRTEIEGVTGTPAKPSPLALEREKSSAALHWIDALGNDAILGICFAGLAVAGIWLTLLIVQSDDLPQMTFAIGYPLCFLSFVLVRGHQFDEDTDGREVMQSLGFLSCAFVVMWVASSNTKWESTGRVLLEAVAALILVTGHTLLDRWIWGGRPQLFLAIVPLWIVGTVLHVAAVPYARPSWEATDYASGILALTAASSVVPALPEFVGNRISPLATRGLLRGLIVALPAAFIFFRRVFF